MSDSITYLNKFSQLTKEAEEDLLPRLKSKSFKKGQVINKEGQICKNLFIGISQVTLSRIRARK
jgi:hypothetical protein